MCSGSSRYSCGALLGISSDVWSQSSDFDTEKHRISTRQTRDKKHFKGGRQEEGSKTWWITSQSKSSPHINSIDDRIYIEALKILNFEMNDRDQSVEKALTMSCLPSIGVFKLTYEYVESKSKWKERQGSHRRSGHSKEWEDAWCVDECDICTSEHCELSTMIRVVWMR